MGCVCNTWARRKHSATASCEQAEPQRASEHGHWSLVPALMLSSCVALGKGSFLSWFPHLYDGVNKRIYLL